MIVYCIQGFVIFWKADCPQLGNHQEQHVGTKQEEPHGGARWRQRDPALESPLSYLKNRKRLERSLCYEKTVFFFGSSSISPPALSRTSQHPFKQEHRQWWKRNLLKYQDKQNQTKPKQQQHSSLRGPSKVPAKLIEVLGTFARVFEVTMSVIITKSPEPQTQYWLLTWQEDGQSQD